MLAKVFSGAGLGLNRRFIEVKVDKRSSKAHFIIMGLPDAAVQESRMRVRSAVRNRGMSLTAGSYTVNLAPADIYKRGPAYDLPIAVGVLAATAQIPHDELEQTMFIGELVGKDNIAPSHIAEAIQYRPRKNEFWMV